MKSRRAAIVLAGGRGTRMGTETPKQLLKLLGRPLLSYTLEAFEQSSADIVVVTAPPGMEEIIRETCVLPFGFRKVKEIVPGGTERCDSVLAGLEALEAAGPDLVAVHDGARPLVTPELIDACFEAADRYGAAAAAVPVKDTIRMAGEDGRFERTIPRQSLRAMQTPQTFRYRACLEAFRSMASSAGSREAITDDVMVMEQYGGIVTAMVQGSYRNLKVTTPEDMAAAEALLKTAQRKDL